MKKVPLFGYLIAIILTTIVFAIIYASVQQGYRTGANDPQIQIARDISLKLHQNKSVDQYFIDTIDIAQSLSPFAVLYDASGKPLRSSGYLNNKMPEMPNGVFEFHKKTKKLAVTWQPQHG